MKYTKAMLPVTTLRKIAALKHMILTDDVNVWNVADQGYPSYFK